MVLRPARHKVVLGVCIPHLRYFSDTQRLECIQSRDSRYCMTEGSTSAQDSGPESVSLPSCACLTKNPRCHRRQAVTVALPRGSTASETTVIHATSRYTSIHGTSRELIASCIRKVSTCHLSSTICSNLSRLVACDWSSRIRRV